MKIEFGRTAWALVAGITLAACGSDSSYSRATEFILADLTANGTRSSGAHQVYWSPRISQEATQERLEGLDSEDIPYAQADEEGRIWYVAAEGVDRAGRRVDDRSSLWIDYWACSTGCVYDLWIHREGPVEPELWEAPPWEASPDAWVRGVWDWNKHFGSLVHYYGDNESDARFPGLFGITLHILVEGEDVSFRTWLDNP